MQHEKRQPTTYSGYPKKWLRWIGKVVSGSLCDELNDRSAEIGRDMCRQAEVMADLQAENDDLRARLSGTLKAIQENRKIEVLKCLKLFARTA